MNNTLRVINEMQADGIIGPYAIGGAVGATFYLEPVATLDIDVFVSFKDVSASTLISLAPLYAWLKERGHTVEGEHVEIHGWPVQFLPSGDALCEEAIEQANSVTVQGEPARIMTAEHLAALALQVGRAKDYARMLQFLEEKALDQDRFSAILTRHSLTPRWEAFLSRFGNQDS
jgi:hypothetical protein